MAITTDDIKIRSSQRLTDDDDGGGYMTSTEIVDGAINNLFPDISRLDRTYGRVSLRKFFMHVDTDTTDTYLGAQLMVAQQAADPNISVALFTTGSESDERIDAVDRLESYVTLGPRFIGWLWGNQPQGARQLLIFAPVNQDSPEINDVLCLFNDFGLSSESYQYVRITGVEAEERTLSIGDTAATRKIFTVDIGDPLQETFAGSEVHNNDGAQTNIYTTVVSDAASYYGVMTPTADIADGDTTIAVDSIYTQLVPTSQAETAITDQTPGDVGPVVSSGINTVIEVDNFDGTVLHLYQSFVPGSLTLTIGTTTYSDNGDGVLLQGSNQAGVIDYPLGKVTFASVVSGSGSATFDPGVAMATTGVTLMVPVPEIGQGYTYVAILWPLPEPKTVMVDYIVDGNWYRLRDDGNGILVPDVSGTGTGRINYVTGQLSITCAAIPDSESAILVRFGTPEEIVPIVGAVDIEIDPVHLTLAESPVEPGSLTVTWQVGISDTGTATDDGNGNIVGDATGWIVYGTGELYFSPTELPLAGTTYDIDYQQYVPQLESLGGSVFTLANPPEPGTLALELVVNVGGSDQVVAMRDDGNGNLNGDGFTDTPSQCRSSLYSSNSYAQSGDGSSNSGSGFAENTTEKTTTVVCGPISGTIDYVTGDVVIDIASVEATQYEVSANATSSTQGSTNSVGDKQSYITIPG